MYRYKDSSGRLYRLGDLKGRCVCGTAVPVSHGVGLTPPIPEAIGLVPNAALPASVKALSTQDKLDYLDNIGRVYWPPNGKVPSYKRYLDEMPGTSIDTIWDDIQEHRLQCK